MLYTSVSNDKIKDLKKLHDKKYRDLKHKFIVEGKHLVEEAYKTGFLEQLIVIEKCNYKLDVDTITVSENVMNYLSSLDTHQEVIGICNQKEMELSGNKVLALDGIQDPGNLGTIIRSAVAFNIDTVLISNDSVDIYNPKVIRASQGMIFKINFVIGDMEDLIVALKKDYRIYGTKVTNGTDIRNIKLSNKSVIVMGNEGNGVSEEVLDLCDEYIYIGMNNSCESLNVAVATSIILYELEK